MFYKSSLRAACLRASVLNYKANIKSVSAYLLLPSVTAGYDKGHVLSWIKIFYFQQF